MLKTLIASALPKLFQTGEKWGIVNHEFTAELCRYVIVDRLTLFAGFIAQKETIGSKRWVET